MLIDNYFLRSLLEAPGDNEDRNEGETNQDANAGENNPEATEEQPPENNENPDDETEEDNDTPEQDDGDEGEETGEDDIGIEDPTEDTGGDDDTTQDSDTTSSEDTYDEVETDEQNIQTNVLNLSKLDRVLMKKKLFSDYQDLRVSLRTSRNLIHDNEENVDPDVREAFYDKIDKLYTNLTDYLSYKFSYTNYEENLQVYLIFAKSLQDILDSMTEKGLKTSNSFKKYKNIKIKQEQ